MSPSLNGSDIPLHHFAFPLSESTQVGEVRRFAAGLAQALGFSETRAGRLSIVINELGNNLIKYGKNGRLLIRAQVAAEMNRIEVISIDEGPGLDVSLVMRDGYTTGSTPGTGLGAVRRQADVFDIYSAKGKGTVIATILDATDTYARAIGKFESGLINLPLHGEKVCGDAIAVDADDDDLDVLVADGLGHGFHANEAAKAAIEVFAERPRSTPEQLMPVIHGRLKSTRGAAVFLARAHGANVVFTGVGNIRAFTTDGTTTKTLISQNGTAGLQIRTPKNMTLPWNNGALILHSDGLTSQVQLLPYPGLIQRHPSVIAATLYRDFTRKTDDASIVVIKRTQAQ